MWRLNDVENTIWDLPIFTTKKLLENTVFSRQSYLDCKMKVEIFGKRILNLNLNPGSFYANLQYVIYEWSPIQHHIWTTPNEFCQQTCHRLVQQQCESCAILKVVRYFSNLADFNLPPSPVPCKVIYPNYYKNSIGYCNFLLFVILDCQGITELLLVVFSYLHWQNKYLQNVSVHALKLRSSAIKSWIT